MAKYALAALTAIYQYGYAYQKVSVILSNLVPDNHRQVSFFCDAPGERLVKLHQVVDRLNHRHGRDKIRMAAQGYDPSWKTKQQ